MNGPGLGCLSVREEIMAFDIYYDNMATHFASSPLQGIQIRQFVPNGVVLRDPLFFISDQE